MKKQGVSFTLFLLLLILIAGLACNSDEGFNPLVILSADALDKISTDSLDPEEMSEPIEIYANEELVLFGELSGNQRLKNRTIDYRFLIDDQLLDSGSCGLDAKTMQFQPYCSVGQLPVGEYTITFEVDPRMVYTLDDPSDNIITRTLIVLSDVKEISVEFTTSEQSMNLGTPFDVTATISNISNDEMVVPWSFAVDFTIIDSGEVTIPAGETVIVTQSYTAEKVGSFQTVFELQLDETQDTDFTNNQGIFNCQIVAGEVTPVLIDTTSVPDGAICIPYGTEQNGEVYFPLSASGGEGNLYEWELENGSLPPGIFLSEDGHLYGSPEEQGTFSFTVYVQDGQNPENFITKSFQMDVTGSLNISFVNADAQLPNVFQCGNFTIDLTKILGVTIDIQGDLTYDPIFEWEASGLPPGISLDNAKGRISGAINTVGSYPIKLTVIETGTCIPLQIQTELTLTVVEQTINITTTALPEGMQCVDYNYVMNANGGTSELYTWTATGLPEGLSIHTTNGSITGTTTESGTFTLDVAVEEQSGCGGLSDAQSFELIINEPPDLEIQEDTLNYVDITKNYPRQCEDYALQLSIVNNFTDTIEWELIWEDYTEGTDGPWTVIDIDNTGLITNIDIIDDRATPGDYNVTVNVVDKGTCVDIVGTKDFTLTLYPSVEIDIEPTNGTGDLGTVYYCLTYSEPMTVTGNEGAITWTLEDSANHPLPDGITLDPVTGEISGDLSTGIGGTYPIRIVATDSSGCVPAYAYFPKVTDSADPGYFYDLVVHVDDPLKISLDEVDPDSTVTDLADGEQCTAYSDFVYIFGGSCDPSSEPGCTWEVGQIDSADPSGALLPLSLPDATFSYSVDTSAKNVEITGTPIVSGDYTIDFVLRETGPCGLTEISKTLSLHLDALPSVSINTPSWDDDDPTITNVYEWCTGSISETIEVSGGPTGVYTFEESVDAPLPTFLSLNATTGEITGSPTTSGDFTFTIKVKDNQYDTCAGENFLDSKTYTIIVNAPTPNLVIDDTTTDLVTTQCDSFSFTFSTTSVNDPGNTFTWSYVTGQELPTEMGMTLNATTGELSGNPKIQGTYTFKIKCLEDNGTCALQDTQSFTLSVSPFTPMAITTAALPEADQCGAIGTYTATLEATGGPSSDPTNYIWTTPAYPDSGCLPHVDIDPDPAVEDYQPILELTTNASGEGVLTNIRNFEDSGIFSINFIVTDSDSSCIPDADNRQTTKTLVFKVNAQPTLEITTFTLDPVTVCQAYSEQLEATLGGTDISTIIPAEVYEWTDPQGKLAGTGISLSTDGALTANAGDITSSGNLLVTFKISRTVAGCTDPFEKSRMLSIVINPLPTVEITTETLPEFDQCDNTISVTMAAEGGPDGAPAGPDDDYTWSATGLPTGINIDNLTGEISGEPSESGTFPISITVTDGSETPCLVTDVKNYMLKVNPMPTVSITETSLPAGSQCIYYADSPVCQAKGVVGTVSGGNTFTAASGTPFAGADAYSYLVVYAEDDIGTYSSECLVDGIYTINSVGGGGQSISISSVAWTNGADRASFQVFNSMHQLHATGGPSGGASIEWSATGLPSGLTIDSATGIISGTPSASGSFNVSITATDTSELPCASVSATKNFPLSISAMPNLTINTSALPDGTQCGGYLPTPSDYSEFIVAAGGPTCHAYTWNATGVPSDFTFEMVEEPAGSGTYVGRLYATAADIQNTGTFMVNLTVSVYDSCLLQETTKMLLFKVEKLPGLSITTTAGPTVERCDSIDFTLSASGGSGSYEWSETNMPGELTLNTSSGQVTGVLKIADNYSIDFKVTDTAVNSACAVIDTTKTLTVKVNELPNLSVAESTIASGEQCVDYTQNLTVSGGPPSGGDEYYYFEEDAVDDLPNGLALTPGPIMIGNISGKVLESGTHQVKLYITDRDKDPADSACWVTIEKSYNLTVSGQPDVNILEETLPDGENCGTYTYTLTASGGMGGTGVIEWSFASGNLPLTFPSATSGVLQGNLTTASSFSGVVHAEDQNCSALYEDQTFDLLVRPEYASNSTAYDVGDFYDGYNNGSGFVGRSDPVTVEGNLYPSCDLQDWYYAGAYDDVSEDLIWNADEWSFRARFTTNPSSFYAIQVWVSPDADFSHAVLVPNGTSGYLVNSEFIYRTDFYDGGGAGVGAGENPCQDAYFYVTDPADAPDPAHYIEQDPNNDVDPAPYGDYSLCQNSTRHFWVVVVKGTGWDGGTGTPPTANQPDMYAIEFSNGY